MSSSAPNPPTASASPGSQSQILDPTAVASTYRINAITPLYVVGTFDKGVTVLSQQVRALNLAWALVQSRSIPTVFDGGERLKLAVIGAGFAGLTFAAALLHKRAPVDITIFEERDTLIPLQQGSDSRWLHPNIYDWPGEGSEASVAMLPVLNWTAARASDVVVQVLGEWKRLVEVEVLKALEAAPSANEALPPTLKLYCNTRHLQIDQCPAGSTRAQVEWVGEQRNPADCTIMAREDATIGSSETFDQVILAIGFGLEIDNPRSYWRNETLGQPSLDQPRRTYLLSGQGDGAMIDLLRLRISQFRQDRILEELFEGKRNLVEGLRALKEEFDQSGQNIGLFQRFEQLSKREDIAGDFEEVRGKLNQRLRRDTEVVLRLNVRNLTELLDGSVSRKSFQNAFLVYLLYKCGGFAISTDKIPDLVRRYALPPEQIVRRHGTKRREQLKRLLSPKLFQLVEADLDDNDTALTQKADIRWDGGYFGHPARADETDKVLDQDRISWRQEYLPGPTALIATALCGTVVGVLAQLRPKAHNFRVTLHRVLSLHQEEPLLQQACDYLGFGPRAAKSTYGRTFLAADATIGLAYSRRAVIRSSKTVTREALRDAMNFLNLRRASREMAKGVRFVLAIPILQPDTDFYLPSPVAGVLYVDSEDEGFWLEDEELASLCSMLANALTGIQGLGPGARKRIRNIELRDLERQAPKPPPAIPSEVANALEIVTSVFAPRTNGPFLFNFDHSDLGPVAVATEAPSAHLG